MLGIHPGDGLGGTGLGAFRIAAAQIALDDLAGVVVVVDSAKGTGDGADLTTDADVFKHIFRAGHGIVDNRLHRTGVQAPRLGALGTGIRGEAPLLVKGEHLDPGFGRVKYPSFS
jgi:hypothetical protein